MTKYDDIRKQLDEWKDEYGVSDYPIVFVGWANLKADNPKSLRLGQCNYYINSYLFSSTYTMIFLGIRFKERKLGWMETSVLWHEFCHACAFLEDSKSDGHNNHWRDLRRRKPHYVLGDWVAKMIYRFL